MAGESRFPEVVQLRHFLIVPMLAMGALIVLSRLADAVLLDRLGTTGQEVFQISRALVITLSMVSLIGWLAVRYRRRYEIQLQERNRELEETRDFLTSIIRDSAEAVVTLDSQDRITSWNRAAQRIFGWTIEEVRGRGIDRMMPDDPRILEERHDIGERVRAGETVSNHETTRMRRDGKPITVRISWSPLRDGSGKIAGSIGIVLDVTAEKEMRERLVENERLAALGEMASHVAHEIRNPLAGIRAACEVLFLKNPSTAVDTEIGHEVVHQVDRLNTTVSEMLQFASPQRVESTPTDLNELIDQVVGIFREDPLSRGLRVEKRSEPGVSQIRVDRRLLEQVLFNLLLNAAQAMNHQGSITISARLEGEFVEVMVSDTGPGIPADALERVFRPFFTTRTEGTGLGLSIVKKIVDSHGGTIEASNRPKGGAEFRILIPV